MRNANIYKIDGVSGAVTLFATLPGSLTVGYIDIDPVHNILFATNYDDGKIYRINLNNGTILNTYDYLNTGTINGSAAPTSELVVGVGYNEMQNKLYYSLYGVNNIKSIRSLELDKSMLCNFVKALHLQYN